MKKASSNYLGTSYYPDPDFVGEFDDFAIYNTALSDADVKALSGDVQADQTKVEAKEQTTQNMSGQKSSVKNQFTDLTISSDRNTISDSITVKGTLKISGVKAKKNKKKVTGKTNVKKATVKVRVKYKEKKKYTKYKKAKVSGKKFTFKSKKLTKGTKVQIKVTKKITGKVSVKKTTVTIKATKSGYKTLTKKYTVK